MGRLGTITLGGQTNREIETGWLGTASSPVTWFGNTVSLSSVSLLHMQANFKREMDKANPYLFFLGIR